MKTLYNKILIVLCLSLLVGCEDNFLDTPPQDQLTDETYWTDENSVKTFAYGFYTAYFTGYGSGWTWGKYFSGESFNDDFGPTSPSRFIQQVPTSGGGWSFTWVRKANIFIDRVQTVEMEEEATNHWTGIGRFFRALEYHDLVKAFGDVPYYDEELTEEDEDKLYKSRDDRSYVMDKVLEDLEFAAENVRESVDNNGQEVNRDVVLAYMSRIMLWEGTWQKYHENDAEKANEYLTAAKWAAEQVINSGKYSLETYREAFNSLDLSGNPEMIMYREYKTGETTHTLVSYNNAEPQTGISKDAMDAYLGSDGLPIKLSSTYQGDKGIDKLMSNRDPRMNETLVDYELRINGIASNFSTTGVSIHKFLNEEIKDTPQGFSLDNNTDAPIIRYGEVLMNYAEAVAELATVGGPAMTQDDLDLSINVLRDRPGIDMPHLELSGDQTAVNGTVFDDPDRDSDVSPVIWEVRRERRIELMMEGFRHNDLRRWKKLEYVDMVDNPDINRGAWVNKADYPDANLSNLTLTDGDTGYIIPASSSADLRTFDDPKVYLDPLPLDQIKLYSDQGATLEQNPGW